MWHVKDLSIFNLNPVLAEIVGAARDEFGIDVVTSAYRVGDPGVHGTQPLRGIDIRCRNSTMGIAIQDWVNNRYQYDPKRPDMKCCLFHAGTSGAYHLHFQSHPSTQRK